MPKQKQVRGGGGAGLEPYLTAWLHMQWQGGSSESVGKLHQPSCTSRPAGSALCRPEGVVPAQVCQLRRSPKGHLGVQDGGFRGHGGVMLEAIYSAAHPCSWQASLPGKVP